MCLACSIYKVSQRAGPKRPRVPNRVCCDIKRSCRPVFFQNGVSISIIVPISVIESDRDRLAWKRHGSRDPGNNIIQRDDPVVPSQISNMGLEYRRGDSDARSEIAEVLLLVVADRMVS